jgi:hypothetical protein
VTGPCPTCRIEVEHIIKLEHAIKRLRVLQRVHRGLRLNLVRDVKARRKAKERHAENRCEHRQHIRALAEHLPTHAERRAA